MSVLSRRGPWYVCVLLVSMLLIANAEAASGPMAGKVDLAPRIEKKPVRPQPSSFGARLEQAPGQGDPATSEPVRFEVEFADAIDPLSFEPADIMQNGSIAVGLWNIVDQGDQRTFTLEATGLVDGTVIPTIPAGAVENASGNSNLGSISADNSVTFGIPACASGIFLYAAVWSPPEIYIYCVGAGGTLTFEDKVDAVADVRDMQPSSDSRSLYYGHSDLLRYIVSTDGSIVPSGTDAVGQGAFDELTLGPGGRYLYGSHSREGGKVLVYDTAPPVDAPLRIQTVGGFYLPGGVAVDPAGSYLHVANYFPVDMNDPGDLITFPVLANGQLDLTDVSLTSFTTRAKYFAVHPALPRLYWTESSGGSVGIGRLVGGTVLDDGTTFSGYGARPLVIDADGSHLYVANNNTDDITVFEVATGTPSFVELVATERRPEHLILHPSGGTLYVASAGNVGDDSEISIYTVQGDGTLVGLATESIPSQGLYRLAIIETIF